MTVKGIFFPLNLHDSLVRPVNYSFGPAGGGLGITANSILEVRENVRQQTP